MAEENGQQIERFDSDEVTEMYCESCFTEGKTGVLACSFCVDCFTYYCENCLKFHKKFLPDHSYQGYDTMPKDFCFEHCELHTIEIVKFYCGKCEVFACASCRADKHKVCDSFHHIPSLLKEFEENRKLEHFQDKLKKVEESISCTEVKTDQMCVDAGMYKENAKRAIKEHRKDVTKHFDNLEATLEAELEKIKDEDEATLAVHSQQLSALKAEFELIKSDFVYTQRTSQKCRILMKVSRNGKNLESLEQNIENLSNETEIHEISYVPSEITKSTTDFGKLVTDKKGEKRKLAQKAGLSLKANRRHKETCIWGCLMLAGIMVIPVLAFIAAGQFIVSTDIAAGQFIVGTEIAAEVEEPIVLENVGNFQTKIADLCYFQLHYLIALDVHKRLLFISTAGKAEILQNHALGDLIAMTEVDKSFFAYTTDRRIYLMQIHSYPNTNDSFFFQTMDYFNFEITPRFIRYKYRKLYVLFDNKLAIIDLHRQTMKYLSLTATSYDTVMIYDERMILLSRYFDNKVDLLDITSKTKIKTLYENKDLVQPGGMTVDNRGNVYICGFGSNNIHVLTNNLSYGRVFLNEIDGIKQPRSIAFSHSENKLFVSSDFHSKIAVFKLSFK